MKFIKKFIVFFVVSILIFSFGINVFAKTYTLGGVAGYISLSKTTDRAYACTSFGEGVSITADRYVKVTLTYSKNGVTYTCSDSASATTCSGHYSDTKAEISVYRPTSKYTVVSATSNHRTTCGNATYTDVLSK